MIRKTLKHSSNGSLSVGIDYVLSDTNSKNEPRPTPPKILFGDKDALLEIEKNMSTKHTYVHSVLSFTNEEASNLTDDDKEQIAISYIEQLAAGLPSPDRLAVLAVDHGDDMHFLCLRKDLESDKSYQPYVQQRGDAHRFELWNESMQEQHSALIDPNDPALIKLSKTGAAHIKEHESKSALRDQVIDDISARFAQQQFKSRDDIIDYLKQRDDIKVERVTDKSISISSVNNESMQNIRLKGALFEKKWPRISNGFKAERAKPKTLKPTFELAKVNAKLKEKAIEKYSESKVEPSVQIHKALQNNNEKFNDVLLNKSAIDSLKNSIDIDTETLENKIENVIWKEAIKAAKSYDAQAVHTDDELIKVAAFVEKHSEFIENYDSYIEHKHDNKMLDENDMYEASEQDIATDNSWIEMYNDVQIARVNVVQQEAKTETKTETKPKPKPQQQQRGSGDISSAVDAIIKKLISDMQQVHNERDQTLKQQSSGYANEAKKSNAPRPSPSKPKGKSKKKKGKK